MVNATDVDNKLNVLNLERSSSNLCSGVDIDWEYSGLVTTLIRIFCGIFALGNLRITEAKTVGTARIISESRI